MRRVTAARVLMGAFFIMERYSRITEKDKREIVLLRGSGCEYLKCLFCDYHLDRCPDEKQNFELNSKVLKRVTGEFKNLEVINSGSVFELDDDTLNLILKICKEKDIKTLHFESHYIYRHKIPELKKRFAGINVKMRLGLETFDYDLREKVFLKGIDERDPQVIAECFDEANFLFGITGQSAESMKRDIAVGLECFDRICVNIMCDNTTPVKPDREVISQFLSEVYPLYVGNDRVDILINNTDFGVGA